ncbi:MAG: hypothetical protein ACK56I_16970, partial [bacterium]
LDEQYKDISQNMFVLSEADEEVEEDAEEGDEEETEGEEDMVDDQGPQPGMDRISRSYGAY